MSSTGATLSGSYAGATGTVSEVGFYYGTSSGNLTTKVTATGTSSPFTKALTGLSPNTPYYYKAYVVEGGEEVLGSEASFTTKAIATATVTTSAASSVTQTSATLNGSYAGATGAVSRYGFKWGTSSGNLSNDTGYSTDTTPFTRGLTGLTAGTTYYFKAYVVEYNEDNATTEYRYGSVLSFTTLQAGQQALPGYLGCYEMPAVSLNNYSAPTSTGAETFGSATWLMHQTTTASQRIVTHRFLYNGSSGDAAKTCDSGSPYRNYTALVDQNKRCALWTAYVMHAGAYPDNETGRVGDFSTSTSYDPAIPQSWQSSGATSDYNSGNGYARGHHCASEDRQTTNYANKQTFYYTNQSPQWQNSFNDGVWRTLEGAVQSFAPTGRDTLYVVVGPLFEGNLTHDSNDGGDVGLPSHFYKCLMLCHFDNGGNMTGAEGVAYLFTNEAHSEGYNATSGGVPVFRKSIDYIESLAGFDFFANVPAAYQNAAEATTASLW